MGVIGDTSGAMLVVLGWFCFGAYELTLALKPMDAPANYHESAYFDASNAASHWN